MDSPACVFRLLSHIYRIHFLKDQVIVQSKRVAHRKTIKRRILHTVCKQMRVIRYVLRFPITHHEVFGLLFLALVRTCLKYDNHFPLLRLSVRDAANSRISYVGIT